MRRIPTDHACLTPEERAEKYRHMRRDGIVQISGPKWRSISERNRDARELKRTAQTLGDNWA